MAARTRHRNLPLADCRSCLSTMASGYFTGRLSERHGEQDCEEFKYSCGVVYQRQYKAFSQELRTDEVR
jgi:hypothetical protein